MGRRNDYIKKIDKLVGKKIHSLRLSHGLSRQQLSQDIGVSQQQLSKYEKGENCISFGRLVLLGQALGTALDYFYSELEKEQDIILTHHQRMGLEVSRNFMKLPNKAHKTVINGLIKTLLKESISSRS